MQTEKRRQLIPQTICLHNRDGECLAKASVLPGLGANLISFLTDKIEFIHWDESAYLTEGRFSGAFTMFPTPCRLANSSYTFDGKHIRQRKNREDVFIHGLVRDEAMEHHNDGNSVTSRLDISPGHPVFEGFPFKCVLTIKHSLSEYRPADSPPGNNRVRLTVSFKIENCDTCDIPFGYGIHPYWRIHGQRGDVMLRIPCDHVMDQHELIPTGTISPTAGTGLDLRNPIGIDKLALDNIFLTRAPKDTVEMIFKAINRKIIIEADGIFTHVIAYTPPTEQFFCIENLTTSPNAPNLVSAGMGDAAHMLVVSSNESIEGRIIYTIEPVEV